MNPYAAIGIVWSFQDLLVLKRSDTVDLPGLWCLPGGHMEDGESPLETLRREVYEETSLGIGAARLLTTIRGVVIYETVFVDENPHVCLNEESVEHAWVTMEQALSLSMVDASAEGILFRMLADPQGGFR